MQVYKQYFADKKFLTSFLGGLILLAVSLVAQFFISAYVNSLPNEPVTDLILSNIRVYDVDLIFVYGSLILIIIGVGVCIKHINKVPFIMKSLALFTLIRSLFVILTHITAFPTHVVIDSTFFNREVFSGIFTGNDLFFSGHTGLPFLLALMFWDNKKLRTIFLGFSFVFAVVVLLGHIHYSIDVLSAFFITYSIFHACRFIFKREHELFLKNNYETL